MEDKRLAFMKWRAVKADGTRNLSSSILEVTDIWTSGNIGSESSILGKNSSRTIVSLFTSSAGTTAQDRPILRDFLDESGSEKWCVANGWHDEEL